MIEIINADQPEFLVEVRFLFEEYQAAIGLSLCFQGFADELAGLPGKYAPPGGRLYLARVDRQLAGCVAMRPIFPETAEMKRLYVKPPFRGTGLGRTLVERVIVDARSVGYRQLWLDTLPSMQAAQKLYFSLGFRDIPPYSCQPNHGVRCLGLELKVQ